MRPPRWKISWRSPRNRQACPIIRLLVGFHGGLYFKAEVLVEEVIKDAKKRPASMISVRTLFLKW
jgi:hypothetical protein